MIDRPDHLVVDVSEEKIKGFLGRVSAEGCCDLPDFLLFALVRGC